MTQRDLPVQDDETPVTAALRKLASLMGWCVTSTTNGAHTKTSYHYSGRAVDLASRDGPGVDTVQLLAIDETIPQVLPLSMISELIYGGPGNICVKDGKIVPGSAMYGREVMDRHRNHVHLAVVENFTYSGGSPMPDDDPNRFNVNAPVVGIAPSYNMETGDIKGYLLVCADGGVFGFGEGAPMFGNVEYVLAGGRNWLPAA